MLAPLGDSCSRARLVRRGEQVIPHSAAPMEGRRPCLQPLYPGESVGKSWPPDATAPSPYSPESLQGLQKASWELSGFLLAAAGWADEGSSAPETWWEYQAWRGDWALNTAETDRERKKKPRNRLDMYSRDAVDSLAANGTNRGVWFQVWSYGIRLRCILFRGSSVGAYISWACLKRV